MNHKFKVGEQVEWNWSRGKVQGTIKEKITSNVTFMGRTIHASEKEPQFLIESNNTNRMAVHKGSALKKIKKT